MEHHPTLKKRVFSTQFFSVSFPLPSLQLSPFAMLQWISRFRHPHEVTKRTLGDWNLERKVTIHHHTPTLEGWAEGHARQKEGIWRIYWCPSVGDTRGVQANPNLHHPNQMIQMERSQEAYPFNFFFRTWLFCCMTVYVYLSPAWESLGLYESLPCLWPESASPLQSQPYVKHARHNNKVSRAPDHRGPLQRQGRHGCSYELSRLNVKMEWISELQERLQ